MNSNAKLTMNQQTQIIRLIKANQQQQLQNVNTANKAGELQKGNMSIKLNTNNDSIELSNSTHTLCLNVSELSIQPVSKIEFSNNSALRGVSNNVSDNSTEYAVSSNLFKNTITEINDNIDNHTHSYNDITDKPQSFPPSQHSHPISEITDLQTNLDGKASAQHSHQISDITNLQTTLDAKASSQHTHSFNELTNLPTIAPSAHRHSTSDIYKTITKTIINEEEEEEEVEEEETLDNVLDNKVDVDTLLASLDNHTHYYKDILDAPPINHEHNIDDIYVNFGDLEPNLNTQHNIMYYLLENLEDITWLTEEQKDTINATGNYNEKYNILLEYMQSNYHVPLLDVATDAAYINNVNYYDLESSDDDELTLQEGGNLQDAIINHKHSIGDIAGLSEVIQNQDGSSSSFGILDLIGFGVDVIEAGFTFGAWKSSAIASAQAQAAGAIATAQQADDMVETLSGTVSGSRGLINSLQSFLTSTKNTFTRINARFTGRAYVPLDSLPL